MCLEGNLLRSICFVHTCWIMWENMLGKQLIHLEHVSAVRFKDYAQGIITDDLSFVPGILKVVFPDVCPQLLHNLVWKKKGALVLTLINITLTQRRFSSMHFTTSVLGSAGWPTIAWSSGDTPQTLFSPPAPPLLLVPAVVLNKMSKNKRHFSADQVQTCIFKVEHLNLMQPSINVQCIRKEKM